MPSGFFLGKTAMADGHASTILATIVNQVAMSSVNTGETIEKDQCFHLKMRVARPARLLNGRVVGCWAFSPETGRAGGEPMSSFFSITRAAMAAVALAALLAGASGCNSTPTVPVPPPEFCGVTPPDASGIAIVSCDAGQTARNIALVYNENWGQGVMQETNDDGSFSTEIEANADDVVIIQIKYDDRLSAEVYMTVPAL
jgi:hypothetical protein